MGLKGRIRRIERPLEPDYLAIPQPDGTVKRFPASAGLDAFLRGVERLRAHHLGDEIPPGHPLTKAALASGDPEYESAFFAIGPDPDSYSVDALSE